MIARIGPMLLSFLGVASVASTCLGQGNTFNPYGNSGYADYREFGTPMYSNNPALPGQAVLNNQPLVSRPRANSYQDYTNDLDGLDSSSTVGRRNSNVPYYQAYQRMNSDYNRVYRPNNTDADRRFYERQKQREQDYAKAMQEPDPVKRAKLLRQLEQDTLDRPAASRSATAKGTNATRPNGTASTGTGRSAAPADRRQTAPPPSASDNSRRSGSISSATRAPAPPSGRSTTAPPPSGSRTGTSRGRSAPDPSTIPVPPPR